MSTARVVRQLTIMVAMLCSGSVMAANVDAGKSIVLHGNEQGVIACSDCHGPDGNGNVEEGYPALAGLNQQYIEMELHEFQQGSRYSPIMDAIAQELSKTDIDNVAKYFASLKRQPEHLLPVSDKPGEHLAKRGNAAQHIPACFSCHGEGAHGVGTIFPALAGQNVTYIEQELRGFRDGDRSDDPNGMMRAVAKHLTNDEIAEVAHYIASLSPAHYIKAAAR